MSTNVVRVPSEVHEEAVRLAAYRRQQPGHLLAEAWREYVDNHRDEFVADLEEAARLLRDGTSEDVAAFASKNAEARGQASANRARSTQKH